MNNNSLAPFNRTLASRDQFYEALFKRPDSFSKLLPYEEFDERTGIFLLRDGSMGAIYQISLHEHEAMPPERIVESVAELKTWFSFSERYSMQVLFDQSFIPARDGIWKQIETAFPDGHPVSQRLFSDRIHALREACEGLKPNSPMRREALISIRYFPEQDGQGSIANLANRGERLLFGEMEQVAKQLNEFSQTLEQFKESSKTKLSRVSGAELVDYLRRFFNPKEYYKRDFATYNHQHSLSDQVIFSAPFADPRGITREGIKTRTITLKMSPKRVFAGGMAAFTELRFPFKLSLNFSFPPKAKIKSYFDIKEFFLQNSPSARAKRQLDELKNVQERLAQDERCLYMTFSVVIEGETEDVLDQRSRALTAIFHNDLECEVVYENDIGFGLCLNSLPLFHSPAADHSSQRYIPILAKDAAFLLPVFDSFRGHPKGGLQVLMSRENALAPHTSFGNETSQHSIYCGNTGSGKSVFALDVIRSAKLMSPEPIAFIIDKKESCKELCKQYGGDLTVFSDKGELPFTPFRGEFDDSKVDFLTQLILTALRLVSPTLVIESFHTSAISRAIKEAYLRRAKEVGVVYVDGALKASGSDDAVSISMDDVIASLGSITAIEEFESMKDSIDKMITHLAPFYGGGNYARYFRAGSKAKRNSNKLLYAYDLDAFDSNETLKVLMSMSVIHEIMTIMKRPENRGRKGVVEIEELGRFGKNNATVSEFVQEASETMRKMGVSIHGIAPNPSVFFETDAGKALYAAADNFNFLSMSADNVRYLAEHSSYFDETTCELARSLETKAGVHSEILYFNKAKTIQGVYRLSDVSVTTKQKSVNKKKETYDLQDRSMADANDNATLEPSE